MMAKIIIIRGNSASGKTSLAKAVQSQFPERAIILSQDTLRRDLLGAHDGFDTPTIPLLIELINFSYHQYDVIIIEGILKSDWYQPVWDHLLQNYPKDCQAYYYDLSFEETLKRHKGRAKANDFGQESLQRWWNDKDYLKLFDEQILSPELSIEAARALILNK
ncbi:AAA family ATPase [Streptococcus hongkongensis]